MSVLPLFHLVLHFWAHYTSLEILDHTRITSSCHDCSPVWYLRHAWSCSRTSGETSCTFSSDRTSLDSHTTLRDTHPVRNRLESDAPCRSAWAAGDKHHTAQVCFVVLENYQSSAHAHTYSSLQDRFVVSNRHSLQLYANTIHHPTLREEGYHQSMPTSSIYTFVDESFYFFAGALAFRASALAFIASFLAFSF